MDLKSRGEKTTMRHLAPDNLKNLRSSLSQQLEIVKLENKPQNTIRNAETDESKPSVIPTFSSLPYRPRIQ